MGQEDTTLLIKPSSLRGEIEIPSSKSHTLRALLFGAFGEGKSHIHQPLNSPDTQAMIRACTLFGAQVREWEELITIEGTGGRVVSQGGEIEAGNSGLVLRLCTAVGALSSHKIRVTGDHSIQTQRPMEPLLDALRQLGVHVLSEKGNGLAPLLVQGPLKGGKATVEGSDSQPISALLIAGALSQEGVELFVNNAGEKPWVALTLEWFERLGIPYQNEHFEHYRTFGNARYKGFIYRVPGDLSSAAFPVAAALVTGSELLVNNVDLLDSQGDKEFFFLLQKMGAVFEVDKEKRTLLVKRGPPLCGTSVDINVCIDALPILATVACFATSSTHIYNGRIARQKECDRIHAIASELKKMGATLTELEDGLVIFPSRLKGTEVNSRKDHRMALSLSVAALGAEGESRIHDAQCICKTFPHFVEQFQRLGAQIERAPCL